MKEEEINKPNEEIVSPASFIDGDKLPIDDGTGDGIGNGGTINGGDENGDEGNIGGGDSNDEDGDRGTGVGTSGPKHELPDRPNGDDDGE